MQNILLLIFLFISIIPPFLYVIKRKYYYYSTIVIYPIIGQSMNAKVDILGLSLNPSMIFGFIVLGVTAVDFFLYSSKNSWLEIAGILFVVYSLVICIFSPIPLESISWSLKIATWLFVLLSASKIFKKEKEIGEIGNAVAIAAMLVIVSFILSRSGFFGKQVTYETGVQSYSGGFANVKVIGYYLAFAIPVIAVKNVSNSFIDKFISKLLIFLSLVVIILNFTRAPIFALLIGYVAYQYYSARYGKKSSLMALALLFLLTSSVFLLFKFFHESPYMSRWVEISKNYSEGQIEKIGSGRVGGLMSFHDYFFHKASKAQIIFGAGLGSTYSFLGTRKFVHNDFAEILTGCGIVGFLIYVSILFSIFRLLQHRVKKAQSSDLIAYNLLAISGFFIFLSLNMANVSSCIIALVPWALLTGAVIGVGESHLKEIRKGNS